MRPSPAPPSFARRHHDMLASDPRRRQDGSTQLKHGILSASPSNPFAAWSTVVIPDCTGDLHIGNATRTYAPADPARCVTVHHRGAVNAGLAVDWALSNFPAAARVLLVGTAPSPASKAPGAHGAAFWAPYVQRRLPGATVRVLLDSALGLYGPAWRDAMAADPWGAADALVPGQTSGGAAAADRLLPPPSAWSLAEDDMTGYYERVARELPGIAFADAGAVEAPLQRAAFALTGGRAADCCLDGCGCDFGVTAPPAAVQPYGVRAGAPPYGTRGGQLDWTKAAKVAALRRLRRLPHNYRYWQIRGLAGPPGYLALDEGAALSACPRPDAAGGGCLTLARFAALFAGAAADDAGAGRVLFGPDGSVTGSTLSGSAPASNGCDAAAPAPAAALPVPFPRAPAHTQSL